jgi:alpha-tubulin suppressor-like RCC1 family protein
MQVGAAGRHSFGLTKQGDLFAWGENPGGVLGNGTTLPQVTPVRIPPQAAWMHIIAGEHFTIGLRKDGSLWAWGDNRHGELGVGNQISSWVPVRVSFPETRTTQKPLVDFSELMPAPR